MGTRSMIGMVEADGSVSAIYCQWDGYLSHNGSLLDENYDSDIKVAELLAGGDLSTLGQTASVLLENGRPAERFDSISDYRLRFNEAGDEFRYLWDGEAWFYIGGGRKVWDDVREGLKDVRYRKAS